MTESTVKEVTVFRVGTFLRKCPGKYNFLGIYEIFNITNKANLDCQMGFQVIINFENSNVDIDNYSFFSLSGKNVRQQLK